MHNNSLKCYAEERPKLGMRAEGILLHVRAYGPMTDRAICERMGYNDLNSVRPRCTELVRSGLLIECGSVKCPVSGKTVRVVSAALV